MNPYNGFHWRDELFGRVLQRLVRGVIGRKDLTRQQRLDLLTKSMAQKLNVDVCSIYLDKAGEGLELFSTHGLDARAVHRIVLAHGQGVIGRVFRFGAQIYLRDVRSDPDFVHHPEIGEDALDAFLGIPITHASLVLGVLVLQRSGEMRFSAAQRSLLGTFAGIFSQIIMHGDLVDESYRQKLENALRIDKIVACKGVVDGIAIGHAVFYQPPFVAPGEAAVDKQGEQALLEASFDALEKFYIAQLEHPGLTLASREILDTYRLLSCDRSWRRRIRGMVDDGFTAKSAVAQIKQDTTRYMKGLRDPFLRERYHDLEDVSYRLLLLLEQGGKNLDPHIANAKAAGAILIARHLGASELLSMEKARPAGLVLSEGSSQSHVVIVAKALGLPTITGCDIDDMLCRENDIVAIEGDSGLLHVEPSSDKLVALRNRQRALKVKQRKLTRLADLPTITRDACEVTLDLNAAILPDMEQLEKTGAAGVGLFRTELSFLIGASLPTRAEQTKFYRSILDAAHGRRICFRLTDIGADKVSGFMTTAREHNPAMGWRGIRMGLDRPGLLRIQLRALILAAAGEALDILIPMIATAEEMQKVRHIVTQEKNRLARMGFIAGEIRIGAMIEIPVAVWDLETIAAYSDFFCVGGNDLFQFFFAADRGNEKIFSRFSFYHPAYVRLLAEVARKADALGKQVSFCGEQAQMPEFFLLLLGVGFRRFSLSAYAIAPLKQIIPLVSVAEIKELLKDNLRHGKDPQRIMRAYIDGLRAGEEKKHKGADARG